MTELLQNKNASTLDVKTVGVKLLTHIQFNIEVAFHKLLKMDIFSGIKSILMLWKNMKSMVTFLQIKSE